MDAIQKALIVTVASWLRILDADISLTRTYNTLTAFYEVATGNGQFPATAFTGLEIVLNWAQSYYQDEIRRLLIMIPPGESELADLLRAEAASGMITRAVSDWLDKNYPEFALDEDQKRAIFS